MTGILDAWSDFEVAGGMAPGTVYLYHRYLLRLADEHDLDTITRDQLAGWMASQAWGPATRKSAMSAMRSYFGWAVQSGARPDDPTVGMKNVRQPPPSPRPTPDKVYARAFQSATSEEMLMLELGVRCGLRRAEIAGLHTDDISDGKLWVRGKGGKRRQIPITSVVLQRLLAEAPEGYLFPGRFPDRPVTPDYVGRRLSKLLGRGWTAHSLRHRYASVVYNGSHNVLALQKLMGHSSPETTQRYVELDEASLWDAARYAAR